MGNPPGPDPRVRNDLGLPGRYEVVRRIASGGMASVWCAHDRALGRKVAIKLLADRFADDEGATARFMREARAAARLSGHPHVVMIYDVGETTGERPGRAFIVMEHLAGGTVADALRVEAARPAEAVRWVGEAASALDYAHGRGVLHRDIKPANLLLDRARVLHVADFGIARLGAEDTITGTGQVLGTAAYLAPERALGRPATEASDRYSLAVAAFELLAGERPFTARNFAAQARQHVEDEPPAATTRNRALPAAVDGVLARGMAKRPERRWATAREFGWALEAALSEPVRRPYRASGTAAAMAATPRIPPWTPTVGHHVRSTAPPTGSLPPGSGRGPRSARGRIPAVAALAAGAAVAAVAVSQIGGGGREHLRVTNGAERPLVTSRRPPVAAKPRRPAPARRRATTRPQPTGTVTATQAASTTPPPTGDTLEARGHQLMLDGDYAAAIPVLRQALAAASPASVTYAYALYDLGRSLRLAGDPRDAATVLYQRLQIPNQTGTVRLQLQLALQALGQQVQQSGGAGAAPAQPPGQRHHGVGPGGGAGQATPPGGPSAPGSGAHGVGAAAPGPPAGPPGPAGPDQGD
jgi:eukaryotic-like serine/threonine-protein kinase